MASLFGFVNKLLPFATPGTPFLQDIVHLGAICAFLYFAPHIQEWYRSRSDAGALAEAIPNQPPQELEAEANEPAQPDEQFEDADAQPDGALDHDIPDQDQPDGEEPNDGQPGPAQQRDNPAQRNVGAKKAKSLAKRDQRRQYHEFMRSQGEIQRARDAEGAAEREAALAAERERRKAAEAALEAKKAKEREQRREAERLEREAEIRRRDLAISLVREELEERKMCDLWKVATQVGGDADDEWVERILKVAGVIGKKGGVLTMVTGTGWVVRVTEEYVQRLYQEAVDTETGNEAGAIGYDQLGGMLENVLRKQTAAAS